eukprot:7339748-Prymnesium_polylepis.1
MGREAANRMIVSFIIYSVFRARAHEPCQSAARVVSQDCRVIKRYFVPVVDRLLPSRVKS